MMSTDPFSPSGPNSALAQAVAILVPFANQRLKGQHRTKLRRTPAYMSKFDIGAHPDETEACRAIGSEYYHRIQRHKDTTTPTEFFAQYREIERLSDRLSHLLNGLRGDARFLLDTVFHEDEQVFHRLSDARSLVRGLPDPSTDAPGQMAVDLKHLSSFLKEYIPVLGERVGGKERKFRSNSPTIGKLTTPSPVWALIGDAWKLFGRYPHLQPSGSADGDLREFVRAVHLWVTGDPTRNLAKTVKKYASYKNQQAILEAQLVTARTTKTRGAGVKTGAPTKVRDRSAANRSLAELEFRLHFEFFPTEKRK